LAENIRHDENRIKRAGRVDMPAKATNWLVRKPDFLSAGVCNGGRAEAVETNDRSVVGIVQRKVGRRWNHVTRPSIGVDVDYE
jgi:hypothetical protein